MVTSHIQWHKKSSLVILSQVYKRKLLKISKSFRVIKKKKTYFQIKLTNQNDLREKTIRGNFPANAHLGARISSQLTQFIAPICPFAFGYFPHFSVFLVNATARQKTCFDAMLFPGNPHPLSMTLGRACCSTGLRFQTQYLLAWRELFINLQELKSRI